MGKLEQKYWNTRYRSGCNSGIGSVGHYRDWFWSVITKHISPEDVIDVGCGDLLFWEGRTCSHYIGIDISKFIIQRNRLHCPEWRFICGDAADYIEGLSAEVVFCIALLFHIEKESEYRKILENLCRYSQKWIIISTWMKKPPVFDSTYQFYHRFEHYFDIFHRYGFTFHAASPCFDNINAVYIFKKEEADSND